MPETHLFRTKRNKYFGTKRFDRDGDARIHMHSLGGLIHADHRSPSLDYDMVLRVTLALTRNIQDAEKAYALACFNVLAHNRDDHVKNFSFLLNARNEWIFAPAYDLVFSYGPGGEQSMLVMGEGRNPGAAQLQALGKQHGIKNAPEILAKVQKAVANWPRYAKEAEVSAKSTRMSQTGSSCSARLRRALGGRVNGTPCLDDRIVAAKFGGRSVVIRELRPQDL